MSAETKAILHRFLEGLFNTGNRAVADACGQWQGRGAGSHHLALCPAPPQRWAEEEQTRLGHPLTTHVAAFELA